MFQLHFWYFPPDPRWFFIAVLFNRCVVPVQVRIAAELGIRFPRCALLVGTIPCPPKGYPQRVCSATLAGRAQRRGLAL
jgi:hypothetical protein